VRWLDVRRTEGRPADAIRSPHAQTGHTLRFDWHDLDIDLIVLDLPRDVGDVVDVAAIEPGAGSVARLRIWWLPTGPAGKDTSFPRRECALVLAAAPERRHAGENKQQLLVFVIEGQKRRDRASLKFVKVRRQATCAGVLARRTARKGAGLRGHLGIPGGEDR
jgi:hypothetical protein